jgi:hypothetical protein
VRLETFLDQELIAFGEMKTVLAK